MFWSKRVKALVSWEAARQRAARGAAYLDTIEPGWYRHIDLKRLELSDGAACVLGQRYGSFFLGLGRSGLLNLSSAPVRSLSPVAYGFLCVQGVDARLQARDYTLLTQAWREEIRRRLGQEALKHSDAGSGEARQRGVRARARSRH
jgi:hypothetical protein